MSKQPREGINVSKTHPLVEAGTLVVGLGIIFALLTIALIFLVEIVLHFIPVEAEKRLFSNWLPDDIVTVAPYDERLVATQELVDSLARHWPDSPYKFTVEIHDSEAPNAMAIPGGLIVVTKGLLDEVESENELAFILGHELGHFQNRDHLRALGRVAVLSLVFAANPGDINMTVADLTLRSYGRKQESRADIYGLQLVQSRYGHVAEAWRLFERWDEKAQSPEVLEYLSTHPNSANRIDNLRDLSNSEGWPLQGDVQPLPWMATLMTLPPADADRE
ncbi:MAG: M48 family metallopeptidase [Pseudomonadota bacterium]